jgi:Na+/melibiose symporter-like transporter
MRRLIGLFHVDLPRPVLLLQLGNAVNSFGFGVVLPFEIVYLHQIRHFSLTTSGLVLSTVMAVAVVTNPPVGALLDRISPRTVLAAASLVSAVAYAGLAFVERPWQAFACSVAAGLGFGAAQSAASPLTMSFISREQRPSAFALNRVALNFGIGAGSLVAGLVVGAFNSIGGFQTIYLLDAASYVGYLVVLLLAIPKVEKADLERPSHGGFRQVVRHRAFMLLLAANVLLVIAGYSLFGNLMGQYALAHTHIPTSAVGLLFLVNTVFIVVAVLPARSVTARLKRHHGLALMAGLWVVACLAVIPAARIGSAAGVVVLLCAVSVMFGIGECFHAVLFGPAVVDIAPPALLARYLSLFALTFTLGLAFGPSLGAAILAASPAGLWLTGAAMATLVGVGFLAAGHLLEPAAEEAVEAAPVPL